MTAKPTIARPSAASIMILALLAAGCGTEGGSSPADVFSRAKASVESKDWAGMMDCVAPDDRPLLSFGLVVAGSVIVGMSSMTGGEKDGAMKTDYEAVLKKHDIDPSNTDMPKLEPSDKDGMRRAAGEMMKGIDHKAFFVDMMRFLSEHGEGDGVSAAGKLKGDLSDVEIDGDRATGRAGGKDLTFVKVDGRWYLELGV